MIQLSNPFDRPLHFLLLELAVLACTGLVLAHAIRSYQRGDRRALFQWLLLTSYGVTMELVAFNFLHNYAHAQFTVQLYDGQLPLYVTGLYGTFMYTGIKVAERLGAHPVVEVLVAGLAMCLIDVPFDIAGVTLGWWRWLDVDPNLAFRWLGVPVTSYYWYLVFGAVAASLCRLMWPRLEKRPFGWAVAAALVGGLLVIFFGVLGFLPFHAIHALGVEEGAIVAGHIAVCALLVFTARGTRQRLSPQILAVAVALPALITAMLVVCALLAPMDDVVPRLGWSIAALLGLGALSIAQPLRRSAATPALATTEST